MLTQIRFTKFGCCSAIGNFEPGDTARIHAAMAKHLVEEAQCAKYVEQPQPEPVVAAPQDPKRKARRS
jgi:hypothetical protein